MLSGDSVEAERAKARQAMEEHEEELGSESEGRQGKPVEETPIRILRVLKNNKLLGQVLRNQYGKLPKERVREIVETIADSSFRIVNLVLKDEQEIRTLAVWIHAQLPEADLGEVQQFLRLWSFGWTMWNIEQAVHSVSVPGIREAVDDVVKRKASPAYEIFGYFCKLDSGDELTNDERDKLMSLYNKHRDEFVKRVLSIRTQWYMNTHRSRMNIEQSICSVLGIEYRPRARSAETRIT